MSIFDDAVKYAKEHGDDMSRDPKSSYYDAGGIELTDIIKAKLTPDGYKGWLLGNVLKYAGRMMFKHDDPLRDCEKAMCYLRMLMAELTEDEA